MKKKIEESTDLHPRRQSCRFPCVRSMMLGAVIMFIGLAVGAIVSPPLIAQRVIVAQNRVFDDVQCKRLTVVDEDGNQAIVLEAGKVRNLITINAKYGKGKIFINASEELGSSIAIFGEDGKGGLLIGAYDEGNVIHLSDKDKGGVFLGTTETNNEIIIHDRYGNDRVHLVSGENADGVIVLDKSGQVRGSIP